MSSLAQSLQTSLIQGWFVFYRDFQYRYSLTFFGYIWSVVRPLAAALPLIFIGRQFDFGSSLPGVPYEVYALTGMLFWNVFWDAVVTPMTMMHRSRSVIRRLPIRPSALVFSSLATILLNFVIGVIILSIVAVIFRVSFAPSMVFAFLAVPLVVGAGLTIGLPFASIGMVYHDLRYGIGFLGQLLIWSAPVIHAVPEQGRLRQINLWNPLTYLIDVPRGWLFGVQAQSLSNFFEASLFISAVFLAAAWFYRRTIKLGWDYVL